MHERGFKHMMCLIAGERTTRMVLLAWEMTNLAWSWVQAVMLVMGAPRRGRNCFTSVPRCQTTCPDTSLKPWLPHNLAWG